MTSSGGLPAPRAVSTCGIAGEVGAATRLVGRRLGRLCGGTQTRAAPGDRHLVPRFVRSAAGARLNNGDRRSAHTARAAPPERACSSAAKRATSRGPDTTGYRNAIPREYLQNMQSARVSAQAPCPGVTLASVPSSWLLLACTWCSPTLSGRVSALTSNRTADSASRRPRP